MSNNNNNKKGEPIENKNENDDDDDEEDEKEKIGVDGWERIDDETFSLTKPENFEKADI